MEANLTYVGMGQWACNDCGYQSQKSNVKRHVESRHLVPTQYTCQLCQRVFHGKNSFDTHIYNNHKEAKLK